MGKGAYIKVVVDVKSCIVPKLVNIPVELFFKKEWLFLWLCEPSF
jgi:hypothetical protein